MISAVKTKKVCLNDKYNDSEKETHQGQMVKG